MEVKFFKELGIAYVLSDEILIKNTQDALDLMADLGYQEYFSIVLNKENLTGDFFELKTGIAGDILQKFSTYDMKLAIIGDFSNVTSKSLKDFIYESNTMRRINFVGTLDEALEKLK